LTELDNTLEQQDVFYVRYMDDVLIMSKRRWGLRKATSRSVEDGETFISKSGDKCPIGYYTSAGSYCKQFLSSDSDAIPRAKSGKCPIGWNTSGGYCMKR
jgi:hypothetical protein